MREWHLAVAFRDEAEGVFTGDDQPGGAALRERYENEIRVSSGFAGIQPYACRDACFLELSVRSDHQSQFVGLAVDRECRDGMRVVARGPGRPALGQQASRQQDMHQSEFRAVDLRDVEPFLDAGEVAATSESRHALAADQRLATRDVLLGELDLADETCRRGQAELRGVRLERHPDSNRDLTTEFVVGGRIELRAVGDRPREVTRDDGR